MLEVKAGITGRALPIGLGVVCVAVRLPGSDFGVALLPFGNTPAEAL